MLLAAVKGMLCSYGHPYEDHSVASSANADEHFLKQLLAARPPNFPHSERLQL